MNPEYRNPTRGRSSKRAKKCGYELLWFEMATGIKGLQKSIKKNQKSGRNKSFKDN